MLRALLIDDDAASRSELRRMLGPWPEIHVVAEADSLRDARVLLGRDDYELVFLDADVADGQGFALISGIRQGARAIVVTSTDAHARRAFDANALDYLLKPVDPARLAITLGRLNLPVFDTSGLPPPFSAALRMEDRLYLKSGATSRWIRLSDISAIRSHENYSIVHFGDGDRTMVRKTLKAWLEVLPALHFVQVHRSVVVNLERVTGSRRHAPKTFSLRIEGIESPFPVGREFWRFLKDRLPRQT